MRHAKKPKFSGNTRTTKLEPEPIRERRMGGAIKGAMGTVEALNKWPQSDVERDWKKRERKRRNGE